MSTKIIPATILRNNLSDTLDEVEKNEQVLLIRRRSKIETALVPVDLLEDLLELHDKAYLKSIRQARQQAKEGKVYAFEEVFGQL